MKYQECNNANPSSNKHLAIMAVREEHNNADKWLAVVFSSRKDWEFI